MARRSAVPNAHDVAAQIKRQVKGAVRAAEQRADTANGASAVHIASRHNVQVARNFGRANSVSVAEASQDAPIVQGGRPAR